MVDQPADRPRVVQDDAELDVAVEAATGFGLRAHQRHRDFASLAGLVHHVDGLIAYALGTEAAWAEPVRERWQSILDTQGRPLG
ncbi:hypothetical protein ACFVYE_39810 [Streptomyces sp. NPDC058239]|uniref:hypothetical protein n=1 Tax=unclassified Streptomyces TaxID=2593676 RepID=UPI00366958CD